MCNSQAEDGQRCYSNVAAALQAAENFFQAVERKRPTQPGFRIPSDKNPDGSHRRLVQADNTSWTIQHSKAMWGLADARTRYASTPQGVTDLTARLNQQILITAQTSNSDFEAYMAAAEEREAYAQAIAAGRRMREQATAIAADVKKGTLTGERATNLTTFPRPDVVTWRNSQLADLEASRGRGWGQYVITPAPLGIRERATWPRNDNAYTSPATSTAPYPGPPDVTPAEPHPKLIALFTVVAGFIMILAGGFTWALVSSQLKDEAITVSAVTPEDPGSLAGKQVAGPFTAYAQAAAIQHHALAGANDRTYAEIGADLSALKDKLKAAGASDADIADNVEVKALTATRTSTMNGTFLRTSLFTSVVSFGVAALVIGLGVIFILLGYALMNVEATMVAVPDSVPAKE